MKKCVSHVRINSITDCPCVTLDALCVRVWAVASVAYTQCVRVCVRVVYVKYAVGSEREREKKIHIHIKSMWALWGSMTYIQFRFTSSTIPCGAANLPCSLSLRSFNLLDSLSHCQFALYFLSLVQFCIFIIFFIYSFHERSIERNK